MGVYSAHTPHTGVGDNVSVWPDLENEPQPDALLCLDAAAGGTSMIDADGYIASPPELIVEIVASSASYDLHNKLLHDKLRVYPRCGVQEYLVWRVYDQAIDWFALSEGRYLPVRTMSCAVASFPAFGLTVRPC
ncbi:MULTISPECIES: Uma2 family endonuclease [Caldilinea]|uniref:Uma2 family endonuclease n=1 Tax=Caldilinea TaxID=233191 RepID=UPI0002DDD4ED|nr:MULTISPECIES: Uma2 family endonuclease [Caldilinea]